MPRSRCSPLMNVRASRRRRASRFDRGSSKRKSRGLCPRARARATRCCSPTGDLLRPARQEMADLQRLGDFLDPRAAGFLSHFSQLQWIGDILLYGHVRIRARNSGTPSQSAAGSAASRHVVVVKVQRALRRGRGGEDAQQRRLTAAGGPEQREELARFNDKIHLVKPR